jgi:hypothetical protein
MTSFPRALLRAAWLAVLVPLAVTACAQTGGPYDLGWGVVSGGGGVYSQGGSYRMSSTLGQSDAGTASGGLYVLRGGFLPLSDRTWLAVPEPPLDVPLAMALRTGAPNPFHGSTRIAFDLTAPRDVKLAVYDVAGHLVRTLANGPHGAGRHRVTWGGQDERGRRASPGLYFIRLDAGDFHSSQRVVLLD